ncbi:MAG: hypothetical protein LBM02_00690 [Lachnospiraceae bacterium]|jgi:hypothetical protein|nr:hypothetical protein [Lachnospiraceae bacterium]
MLGKLLKYDMKAISKFLIIVHAALLGVAVIISFMASYYSKGSKSNTSFSVNLENGIGSAIFLILIIIAIVIFIGAYYGTYIISASRYYKNIYSDEGYLLNTLPVSKDKILLSKIIMATIWGIADIVVIIISFMILFKVTPSKISSVLRTAVTSDGETFWSMWGSLIIVLIVTFIIQTIVSIITIYFSITIGDVFFGHRVVGAIVSYVVISFIVGITSGLISAGFSSSHAFNHEPDSMEAAVKAMQGIKVVGTRLMIAEIVFMIIIGAVMYFLTRYMLNKKLNLE